MLHQTQSLFNIILAKIDIGVIICDADYLIQQVNETFEKMTGYSSEKVIEKSLKTFTSETREEDTFSTMIESLDNKSFWIGNIKFRCQDEKIEQFHLSIYVSYNQTGEPCNYVAIIRDLSEGRNPDKISEFGAYYDSLTGLPDSRLFKDRSEQSIIAARRAKKSVAILVFGLDGFAIINDGLGYKFGDSLLKSVVVRLESCIRSSDTVARLDGDRFALVLQVASADDGVKIAEKLVQAMKQPFIIDGREVGVTASIGISLYPVDGENVDVLARRAESAMRHAKKAGGGRYVFFANDMNMKAKMRIEMEGNLRRAIQQKEFLLYYQPKVDVDTQQIIGMEALIRWNDPEKGIISPMVFIPVAEETGLIEQIDLWGLREACFQNKRWQDNGLQSVRVSVNISSRQFSSSDLINDIKGVLEASGLSSQYLELEITESLLMTNTEDNIQKLQQIRDMGCHLSIDDFGTGYSSLSYLTRFPISTLKIDRAFIRDIETNKNTAEITLAIIGMSKGLKLEVVAEGAETIKHIDFLRKHGCKTAQGFYYSRPVPAEEFEKLLTIGFIKKD